MTDDIDNTDLCLSEEILVFFLWSIVEGQRSHQTKCKTGKH